MAHSTSKFCFTVDYSSMPLCGDEGGCRTGHQTRTQTCMMDASRCDSGDMQTPIERSRAQRNERQNVRMVVGSRGVVEDVLVAGGWWVVGRGKVDGKSILM